MAIKKETIRRFVNYLNNPDENGGFWLPNIQRKFVWNEEKICKLFDSILREYPIGSLLVWKTNNSVRCRKFIDNYKEDIRLLDFYIPENNRTKLLVLDGQQRLQSLLIGLKGSYEEKELAINILSGEVDSPEDNKYLFRFKKNNDILFPWIKFKDIIFSNRRFNQISAEIISNAPQLDQEQKSKVDTLVSTIIQVFTMEENIVYQEIDQIDSPDIYTEDDVVEVFIRANSAGTTLSKSDLMFSLLTTSWSESEANIEELLKEINRTGYSFSRDFILKTCLVLINKGSKYDVRKFREEDNRKIIIENWENISDAIKDVKDYIYGKTYIKSNKSLTSYLALIPIIYFRYHFKEKWNNCTNLNKFIIRVLLTGAFSGNPDNLIDKCVKKIIEMKNFDINEVYSVIKEDGRSLEISKDLILKQYYGSKEIHLLFNLWYDFNYTPAYTNNEPQADHIFPQSKLKQFKIVNPETGRRSLLKYQWYDRDQIANLMLLTAEENGSGGKSDKLPEDWFIDKDNTYLELHLIPKDKELWKIENFEKFIEERQKLIIDKFKYLLIS